MSKAIEQTLVPTNPFAAAGPNGLELIILCASLVVALVFLTYLARCYLQEFRRERRVERRKKISRANCDPSGFEPLCYERVPTLEPPHEGTSQDFARPAVGNLDCWGLQWVIPEHEQITMVWETPASGQASSVHYVQRTDTSRMGANAR
jgi:hypothetical protein